MSKYSQRFREAKAIIATLEGEKAHSSITDWVEILTSERYTEDSLDGVTELMESIRLQGYEGVTESSRAIRKKLKYGNVHRQIRALTVSSVGLEAYVSPNAGPFTDSSGTVGKRDQRLPALFRKPAAGSAFAGYGNGCKSLPSDLIWSMRSYSIDSRSQIQKSSASSYRCFMHGILLIM